MIGDPRAFYAADLYYFQGMSQKEIAEKLEVERSTVSRMLDRLRREGYIQITIHDPYRTDDELQARLVERFDLKDARVVPSEFSPVEMSRKLIGVAAAQYVGKQIRAGFRVGLGWGSTVQAVVSSLVDVPSIGITVVPLMGGVGAVGADLQVHDLATQMASAFSGRVLPLYAPTILDSASMLDGLLADPGIRIVVEAWNSLDMAVVGIGPGMDASPMVSTPYVRSADVEDLQRAGAVGDVCCRFFTREGERCRASINERMLAIPTETLRQVPTVIGVAGGSNKVQAILGAMKGRLVNCLVTDAGTARLLLQAVERME